MFSILPDKRKVKRAGFTLIEMLVVMAIFSLIASFVTSQTQETRIDARDAQRKQDLNALRTAMGVFRDQKDRFPTDLNEVKTEGVMNTLPEDPSEGTSYGYATGTASFDICLAACMEKANNATGPAVCDKSGVSYNHPSNYVADCDSSKLHYLAL